MRFRYALVITTAMVFALPAVGNAAPRDDKITIIKQLASRVGKVLGAASPCRDIARPRVKAVTDKMMEVILASGASRDELSSVLETFDDAVAEGERGAAGAQSGCSSTERESSRFGTGSRGIAAGCCSSSTLNCGSSSCHGFPISGSSPGQRSDLDLRYSRYNG